MAGSDLRGVRKASPIPVPLLISRSDSENKENSMDSGNKERSKSESEDAEASLQLRLDDTMDLSSSSERGGGRNGSMETRHDDSPMVDTQSRDCSGQGPSDSKTFDDSVIEIIGDSPAGKDKSIIELLDSKDDLKLDMSDGRGSGEGGRQMSEILASNSLLYDNVDNLDKVIDDDEDVQSMLAHQSMDIGDDLEDSIDLFDKSSEINLLSPHKSNKSKKDVWSPKKEIWSAKNEKKRKLREVSLSPTAEENCKKKVATLAESEAVGEDGKEVEEDPTLARISSKPEPYQDSGSESSRPGSSQHMVVSPDVSWGTPVPGEQDNKRTYKPNLQTSTPSASTNRRAVLSSPELQRRKNLESEKEATKERGSPTHGQEFKAPTPMTSPQGHSRVLRIDLGRTTEEDLFSFLNTTREDLNRFLKPNGGCVSGPEERKEPEDPVGRRVKRVSDASSLSKSSGSSGYLASGSSGLTSSSEGSSRGRSRLSLMPETPIEDHTVIAPLPRMTEAVEKEGKQYERTSGDVLEHCENEGTSVAGEDRDAVEVEKKAEKKSSSITGPNVSFVDDTGTGVIASQVPGEGKDSKKIEADTKESRKGGKKAEKEKKLVKKRQPKVKLEKRMEAVEEEEKDVESAVSDRFAVGTKVFAKWVDGTGVYFYPADVVERLNEEQARVRFCEDEIEKVLATESDVISAHHLCPGDCVTVNYDKFKAYEVTASLLQYPSMHGNRVSYELAITATESEPGPNEDSRCVDHNDVKLTDGQACAILRRRGLVPTLNKVSAEINFENLCYSKRKTRAPSRGLDSPSTPRRKRGGENVEESAVSAAASESSTSTEEPKSAPGPKRRLTTPSKRGKAGKPSTPVSSGVQQRKGKRLVSSDDEDEVMPKSSSRMQAIAEARESAAVASPKSSSSRRSKKLMEIFSGHAFVLNTSSQRPLPMTYAEEEDFTDNEFVVSNATPRFDRKRLTDIIVTNGGEVMEEFPTQTNPAPTLDRTLFVVSDRHSLTMTYILALADGVPIVSHLFLFDCVAAQSLQEYKSYLLPAGFSTLLMREVEQGQDCTNDLRVNDCLLPCRVSRQRKDEDASLKCLSGLHVLVVSVEEAFTEVWQSVLNSLGASVSRRHDKTKLDKLRPPDVVVTDSKAPKAICKELNAKSQDIPVVSTKWVIQCVVNNARVAYNNFKCKLQPA